MFDAEIGPAGATKRPQPVWSLWEMLKAYAEQFSRIDRGLLYLMDRYPTTHAHELYIQKHHNKDNWGLFAEEQLQAIGSLMRQLPLGAAVTKQLDRTLLIFKDEYQFSFLHAEIGNLYSRFRDEMEDLQFLHITPVLAEGLGEAPPFGEAVDQAFPSASLEIRDAARCLALGQGTAAVFHCMRALEPALRALGAEFDVEMLESENWNSVLNDIQTAVRNRDNSKNRPNWKEDEPYYMEACTHFFIIKNAWRNHTMHLKLRFTEKDALSVYEHTRAFMQHLATRLSEDVEGASPEQSDQ